MSRTAFEDDLPYLRSKWRGDVTDRSTGLEIEELKAEARRIADEGRRSSRPWCLVKADIFRMALERMSVGFSPHDHFPAFSCWSKRDRVMTPLLRERVEEIDARYSPDAKEKRAVARGFEIRHDYDHAVPDWDRLLAIGFTGMKAAADASSATNDFARAMRVAADAMLANVRRLADAARSSPHAAEPRVRLAAEALESLCEGPPKTVYEAMMFQLLYFFYGEHVDHLQVRTLGNWDRLMRPYYEADVAAGRITREGFADLVRHFWWQWGSLDNWWGQPVYIGGTKADGSTEYCDVSRIVLEVADELALPTPKLQMKIAANTPRDVFDKGLDMARRHRSLVFCGEEPMARAMDAMGFTREEARTCDIWGCYEFQPRATANTTLPCIVNFPQIVCDLLGDARAGRLECATFGDFRRAFRELAAARIATALDLVKSFEAHMDEWIPALVHSLSIASCVEEGRNAIGDGMRNNLTVILQAGAGTAADALAAVSEIVYERRLMTLAGLGEAMAADWKGHEELRLRMRASRRRWGNNDPFANELMRGILHDFGSCVNGKPNSRGGRFFAGGHSIDFFHILARRTGATPDGRRAGEEFSKNISPAPGADREGPTALVDGIGAIDARDIPGDVIVDMMVHPSLVIGDKGLLAMRALVERYFAVGGCAIHFNVFSAEELRDAQAHPERYENLQVRVCGWNVRWNDLPRRQQDAYIRRAEEVMKAW